MPFQTRTLVAALGLGLSTALPIRAQEAPMLGFTSESAEEQRRLETLFDEQINRDNLREWMERITAEPFFVGTPHNKENAEGVADLFLRDRVFAPTCICFQILDQRAPEPVVESHPIERRDDHFRSIGRLRHCDQLAYRHVEFDQLCAERIDTRVVVGICFTHVARGMLT